MTAIIAGIFLILMVCGFFYLKIRVDRVVSGEEWIRKIRDEVDELVLEMNQTAERNVALLENRVTVLKELLDQADSKLQIMQKESEKSDLSRQVYSHLKKNAVTRPHHSDKEEKEPELFDEIALPVREKKDDSPSSDNRPLRQKVMELYEQGFGAEIISQRLGASISEVDLIINLTTGGSN